MALRSTCCNLRRGVPVRIEKYGCIFYTANDKPQTMQIVAFDGVKCYQSFGNFERGALHLPIDGYATWTPSN